MGLKRTISVVEGSSSFGGRSSKRMKRSAKTSRKYPRTMALPYESGPERKRMDAGFSQTVTNGSSGMNILFLNGVATGSDEGNRIGRKVQCKSIGIEGTFTGPTNSLVNETKDDTIIRWWIISDNDPNGNLPTPAQMFEAVGGSYVQAFNNTDYTARFKTVRTGTFSLASMTLVTAAGVNAPGPGGGSPQAYHLKVHAKLDNTTKYIGTGSTISNVGSGALYFCCCCSANGDFQNAAFNIGARVMFTDL